MVTSVHPSHERKSGLVRRLLGIRAKFLSEAFWVAVGQSIGALGSLAGVRVLTQALRPTAYGELALGMTAATLMLQVLLAPLSTTTLRFFAAAQERHELRSFFSAIRRLFFISAVVIGAFTAIVAVATTAVDASRWVPLVIGSFSFALMSGASSVLDGMQNAARQRIIVAWHDGIAPWLRFGCAVGLIAWLSRATSGVAMTGYVAASVAVVGSQLMFFNMRIRHLAAGELVSAADREKWLRELRAYGMPFVTWGLFTWAQLASDRWALGLLRSTHDVGLYAAVYQLGFYPILMLSQVLTQLLMPVLFERAGDARDDVRLRASIRLNRQLMVAVLALTGAAVIVACVAHPLVARMFLASEYRPSSFYLPWIVLGGGLYATGQVTSLIFMTANRSSALIAPKVVTAIVGVAFNFAGAALFGVAGVIAAGVLSATFYCLWLIAAARRQPGFRA